MVLARCPVPTQAWCLVEGWCLIGVSEPSYLLPVGDAGSCTGHVTSGPLVIGPGTQGTEVTAGHRTPTSLPHQPISRDSSRAPTCLSFLPCERKGPRGLCEEGGSRSPHRGSDGAGGQWAPRVGAALMSAHARGSRVGAPWGPRQGMASRDAAVSQPRHLDSSDGGHSSLCPAKSTSHNSYSRPALPGGKCQKNSLERRDTERE